MMTRHIQTIAKKSVAFGIGGKKGKNMFNMVVLYATVIGTALALYFSNGIEEPIPEPPSAGVVSFGTQDPCFIVALVEVAAELEEMGILTWIAACEASQ